MLSQRVAPTEEGSQSGIRSAQPQTFATATEALEHYEDEIIGPDALESIHQRLTELGFFPGTSHAVTSSIPRTPLETELGKLVSILVYAAIHTLSHV